MDHTTIMITAEEQLENFGNFLEEHDKKLKKILQQPSIFSNDQEPPFGMKPIIHIDYCGNEEKLSLLNILESNRLLNKVLLTFTHLFEEIDNLSKEAKRMQLKFLYLNEELCTILEEKYATTKDLNKSKGQKNIEPNQVLLKISEYIEFLYHIQFLIHRYILLGSNILQQCGILLAQESNDNSIKMKLIYTCDYLSELFYHIIIFDEILHRSNFAHHWIVYKKAVESIVYNIDNLIDLKNECSLTELNGLPNCLQELDFIFTGSIIKHFVDGMFNLKEKIGPQGISKLCQHFNDYMKHQLGIIEKFDAEALNEFNEAPVLIKLNAFCVISHHFCGQIDNRSIKQLFHLNNKYQAIMLIANIPWHWTQFFQKNAVFLIKPYEKLMVDFKKQQQLYLNSHTSSLKRYVSSYVTEIILWTLKMNRALHMKNFLIRIDDLKDLAILLLQGAQTGGRLSFLIKGIINMHEILQMPMTKQCLLSICKLIEMLKMIQFYFEEQTENIAKAMHYILQYLQYRVLQLINNCKKKITATKLGEQSVDALAALKIIERCLYGPPSKTRLLVSKLAFDACNVKQLHRYITVQQQDRYRALINRIELMTEFQFRIEQICDTSFLYWHRTILSVYLKEIIDKKRDFHSHQYLLNTINEFDSMLNSMDLGDLNINESLKKWNFENLRLEIISKLCAKVEIFLRLEVHANIQLQTNNPFTYDERDIAGLNDYRFLIHCRPLQLNGRYIVLKDHVENYLSAVFYNLTTISLNDWKTYEKMRNIAKQRLQLQLMDDYLPNQSLEQGIDILEIMRKIHVFVSNYVYNMNAQVFIEQHSANKHLDTIGIEHVANSLRTHGTGIINTAVNFTYQFLRQKFYTFSQFLYDEQIKSRLMKDLRAFADNKQNGKRPLYPYERAESFNRSIRSLGLVSSGETYMDLFRKLITHVGNAIGYIRLFRSGSIHANYNASLYLPKINENLQFVQLCSEQNLSEETLQAAENVETSIRNIQKNFADTTDYFKLLVDVFQSFFRNPHNFHLKNFYLIVPPLIMNFIDHILTGKANINKRNCDEGILFDDGFAVGLAYILKLLDQISDFNSLQWFDTVREHFESERRRIQQMQVNINEKKSKKTFKIHGNKTTQQKYDEEKLRQTWILTDRRINAYQMEYNLLYYNLSSAKVFFR